MSKSPLSFPLKHVRSVTRTIRLPEDVDEALKVQASKTRFSPNFIVTQALRYHLEWQMHSQRFGFVTTTRRTWTRLVSILTEEEARTLGRHVGNNEWQDYVMFFFKQLTLDTCLRAAELLGSTYANTWTYDHAFNNGVHTVILKHDAGLRNSQLLGEAARSLLGRLNLELEVLESEDQVNIIIRAPELSRNPILAVSKSPRENLSPSVAPR